MSDRVTVDHLWTKQITAKRTKFVRRARIARAVAKLAAAAAPTEQPAPAAPAARRRKKAT